MHLRDPADERQTEAAAARLRGEEVVERALPRPGAHTDAGVMHRNDEAARLVRAARADHHRAGRWNRLEGVLQQVLERPGDEIPIGEARGEIGGELGPDTDPIAAGERLEGDELPDDVVQLNRRSDRFDPAEPLVILDHTQKTVDLIAQEVEELGPIVYRTSLPALLAQELRRAL